jgi:gliding motility-associated-like protein
VDALTGFITYTPAENYTGNDSFRYSVKDADGAISNYATVTVSILPINDAPVALNDQATSRQVPINLDIIANDIDVDNALDASSIVIMSDPTNGSLSIDNTTGSVTYVPNIDFLGNDSFTYQILDPSGATSNIASVSILVTPANKPPVALEDQASYSLNFPFTIDVLANDSDPDHLLQELTIVSVSDPNIGSVTLENGIVTYHPTGMEQSATITFSYILQDPEGLTDTATVVIDYIYQPLVVSEGFSPNGDGNNDYWYIRSIENYPNNTLKVFDRWGLEVYNGRNYDNAGVLWDGRANRGMTSGNLLDQGTYFYTLDLGNNTKTFSGYVVIIR